MKLFLHNKLRAAQCIEATRLLVTADNGTPLALIIDHGGGAVSVASVEDPDELHRQLKQNGITQTIQVTDLAGPELANLGHFHG